MEIYFSLHNCKEELGFQPFQTISISATYTGLGSYSFNGQEKDNEVKQGIYTAEYLEYDSRIGRRWNLDSKPTQTISNYVCFLNNPLFFVDIKSDNL